MISVVIWRFIDNKMKQNYLDLPGGAGGAVGGAGRPPNITVGETLIVLICTSCYLYHFSRNHGYTFTVHFLSRIIITRFHTLSMQGAFNVHRLFYHGYH